MQAGGVHWLFLASLLIAANLPFFTPRYFIIGKQGAGRSLGWRLLEMACYSALAVGVGLAFEKSLGQIAPQSWQFYITLICLTLTMAFPGFVWRYLLKQGRA